MGPGQDRRGAGKRARAGLRVAWYGADKRGWNGDSTGTGAGTGAQKRIANDTKRGWDRGWDRGWK